MKKVVRLFRAVFLTGLLLWLALAAVVVGDGLTDEIGPADVAVVLGSKVMPDGKPSPRLQARLERALQLYQAGLCPHIIVSGGTGAEGYSEAAVMADYLQSRGVEPLAIVQDAVGITTRATAEHAAQIMHRAGWTSAVVVTQYFHILRSHFALRAAGIQTVYDAHAFFFEGRDIYSIVRETLALPVYAIRFLQNRD